MSTQEKDQRENLLDSSFGEELMSEDSLFLFGKILLSKIKRRKQN